MTDFNLRDFAYPSGKWSQQIDPVDTQIAGSELNWRQRYLGAQSISDPKQPDTQTHAT